MIMLILAFIEMITQTLQLKLPTKLTLFVKGLDQWEWNDEMNLEFWLVTQAEKMDQNFLLHFHWKKAYKLCNWIKELV